ncbi:hypothetical protein [Acidithiobacillus ferridurans]|uniref:Uncharacterized protein n=1 Tax=Acidithiobacillus ferridurans TaxID=1232575 RepID=A0A8X8G7K2_ACIFI|nr:hypothetical protein [Acidithiobacillus ferridurans]MBU2715853.1 hypothetical protein [Acidithiobacillus ferridurans]MBU2723425.1 hypothetical protein [Acidithiobacillus ferridurans]MBU2728042.1 hypothetical protein [Acidithiobacillus ferridurans]MDA8378039.1 hypothetical protein [Planctomycetia bacterium]
MNESSSNTSGNGFFGSREHYLAFRKAWKASCKERKQTALLFAIYALMRGKSLDTVFTPVTNPTKLANGQKPDGAKQEAIRALKSLDRAMTFNNTTWQTVRESLLAPFGGVEMERSFKAALWAALK